MQCVGATASTRGFQLAGSGEGINTITVSRGLREFVRIADYAPTRGTIVDRISRDQSREAVYFVAVRLDRLSRSR